MATAGIPRHFCILLLLALGGCDEPRSEARSNEPEKNYRPTTIALQPAESSKKLEGIATLVSPDALAQINADLKAAEITANFSSRAFARYDGTKSLPQHLIDNAERQAATDSTQAKLLQLKLRNTWGDTAPFLAAEARQQLVDELSSGRITLVRLDFPRSVDRELKNVRVQPLGGGTEETVSTIWVAPSGSLAMPGTSFFGLMPTGPGLRPGDRARVVAEREIESNGVVIPASAIVVYQSASWCYVESQPGTYTRKLVALTDPVEDGYLVKDFEPGTKVVSRGASVLLSREAEPAGDDDDDAKPAAAASEKSEHKTPIRPVASSDPD